MNVQQSIESKLTEALQPVFLDVLNESHMHSVPANSETHFKVVVVSPDFETLRLVQRHQRVYQTLQAELSGGVHALALHTFSPDEWAERQQVQPSPQCMGGSKAD